MTTYQELHWDSINFLKNHLYRRLASPLNDALGRLAIARHLENAEAAREQYDRVEQSLEIAVNLIKAWAALIHVQSGGIIRDYQRRQLMPDSLPAWLINHLNSFTPCRIEHTQPMFVHPESFYESLILLCDIGKAIGGLKYLTMADAKGSRTGIWIRAAFEPPKHGPYTSLGALIACLDKQSAEDQDTAVQLHVLSGFLKINQARFTLQNNTQSGEQALTALFPASAQRSVMSPPDGEQSSVNIPPSAMSRLAAIAAVLVTSPSESADPIPAQEGGETTPRAPILAGPVLARAPREAELAATGTAEPDTTQHTISGPVLAPTPRTVATPPTEDASDTLLVPPPDFRQQLLATASRQETPKSGEDTLLVPPPDFRQFLQDSQPTPPDDSATRGEEQP